MRNILSFLKKHIAEIALVVFAICLAFVNYKPNTTLTGWDNLHPEYNLPVNIARSFSSVWQEYQGVGLVGGMAHAADLPRQLLLVPLSLVFPVQLIRYISTFSYLVIGPLGAFYLFRFLFQNKKLAAFVGALFYLLNLATVQTFYVPYESFVAFFGFLPWFLLSILSFLENPKMKEKILLLVIFILGSTAFYVQTLFIVLMIVSTFFVVNRFFTKGKKALKPVLVLGSIVFAATAFWLLPVLHFTLTNVQVVSQNKINAIATVETQYMNQSFGSLSNIAQLKGFWTNYIDAQGSGYGYLMNDWHTFLNAQSTITSSYLLFGAALIGLSSVVLLRKKVRYPFVYPTLLLFTILMLTAGNGTVGNAFSTIFDKIPLFGQIFRSSFTKWSTVASLVFGWGIGLTILVFQEVKYIKKLIAAPVVAVLCVGLMIFAVKPVFQGKLISDNMKLQVPVEYQSLFSYLKTQPKQARIAVLPVQQIWGWDFYDWGYRGSGFLWYGIEQPILDRAFDVWSHEDENFYQEFEYAWYRGNASEVTNVLTKYQVPFALVDRSVQIPTAPNKDSLALANAESLLNSSGYKKVWSQGSLELYKNNTISTTFTGSVQSPQKVETTNWGKVDSAYKNNSDYIYDEKGIHFLFSKSTAEQISPTFKSDLFGHEFATFTASNPTSNNVLSIPSQSGTLFLSGFIEYKNRTITIRFLDPYTIFDNDAQIFTQSLKPLYIQTATELDQVAIQLGGKVFYISQNQQSAFKGILIDTDNPLTVEVFNASEQKVVSLSDAFLSAKMNTCWERVPGDGEVQQNVKDGVLSVATKNAVECASYKIGSYPGNKHLLSISVPFQSRDRARPDFCLVIEGSSDCLHDEVFYNSQTSTTWATEKRDVLVDAANTYWLVLSARPSDTPDEVWHIEYKAPSVGIMSNIAEFKIEPAYWEQVTKPQEIKLGTGTHKVSVQFPVSSQDFNPDFSGRGGAYNCDIFKRGTAERAVSGATVTFTAENDAISCDYRLLSHISQDKEYMLRVQGQTAYGRGPKIYLFNEATKKNDIEALLTGKTFDTSFAVLSQAAPDKVKKEFTLNYESRSFGSLGAMNTISQVKVYPFNLTWLSMWNVNNGFSTETSSTASIPSTKILTFLYVVPTQTVAKDAYLSLAQGYNPGWIAFSRSGILQHTRLNGWENAWRLANQSGAVYIVYVPQILEYVGFGLIIMTVGVFVHGSRRED